MVVGAITGAGATIGAGAGATMLVVVGDNTLIVVGAITGATVGDIVGDTVGETMGVTIGDSTLGVVVVTTGAASVVVNDLVGEMIAGAVVATGVVATTPVVSNVPDFKVVVGVIVAPVEDSVLAVPSVVVLPPVASGVSLLFAPTDCEGVAPSLAPRV